MTTVTQTTTRYTKIDGVGYEIISEEVSTFEIGENDEFPQDYWVNELKQISFS